MHRKWEHMIGVNIGSDNSRRASPWTRSGSTHNTLMIILSGSMTRNRIKLFRWQEYVFCIICILYAKPFYLVCVIYK
jgi:hypothetical protein